MALIIFLTIGGLLTTGCLFIQMFMDEDDNKDENERREDHEQ